jgi:hypothetical protein
MGAGSGKVSKGAATSGSKKFLVFGGRTVETGPITEKH